MITATSTTQVLGYTVEFTRLFADIWPDTSYWTKVRILKNEKSLFDAKEMENFSGFYTDDGIGNWLMSADDLKNKAIKDITGDGIPELILKGYSGGAHCCSHNYVISLSNPLSTLFDLYTGNYGIEFKDLNHDGVMEIETYEDAFSYWHASFGASPMPRVVLSLQAGKYKPDSLLMREPAPTDAEIKKMANIITSWSSSAGPDVAWKYAIDLIYSGNINSARKYVDLAWRDDKSNEFQTKDDFWKELKEEIKTSPYYSDLSVYFGL